LFSLQLVVFCCLPGGGNAGFKGEIMQIVTDSGTDLWLSKEQAADLAIHIVPLIVTLDGKSYQEGIDIEPGDFYQLLSASKNLPVTSQPSAGTFAEIYRRLSITEPGLRMWIQKHCLQLLDGRL